METRKIALQFVDPPSNAHRIDFDEEEIIALAKDIRDRGLINPITVAANGDRYEVVAGHRRYLALQHMGIPAADFRILPNNDPETIERVRLAENLHRANLSPMEEAIQIASLLQSCNNDPKAAAKICHRSPEWILTRAAIMAAPDDIQQLLHAKLLSIGAAVQLARLDDPAIRTYFSDLAQRDGCTVATLARWIDEHIAQLQRNPTAAPELPPMPEPGQRVTVTMPCDLCELATDVRDRMPKFLCLSCRAKWHDLQQACAAAEHLLAEQQANAEAHA